ncbi:EAL domain-containing protein [Oxalobacteraceae bacterium OM1]|nr:EAL domain-containing protein [Oxalobacteraceae bacterium OM1]
MSADFPALEQYLAHLCAEPKAHARVWADHGGRALGRFFQSTLASAFQSIREPGGQWVAYEAFTRSHAEGDGGLSVWRLLDHAASDDESVELDRLCRMLHAINFFRQPASAGHDVYMSVHARLLAAVDGNHGTAFRRVLSALGVPQKRVVLQLPAIGAHQAWLLAYVADNYRRNGFRIALNAADPQDALQLVQRLRPEVVKLDVRDGVDDAAVLHLLEVCGSAGTRLIFKRVQTPQGLDVVRRIAAVSLQPVLMQGFLFDMPNGELGTARFQAAA